MASIHVCDICKNEGKLVEVKTYMTVKGLPQLRLDYCKDCEHKFAGLKMREYVKFVFKTLHNQVISEESITNLLKRN